ncbi:MAG: nucleotide exchange factor GrpE [Coxiellaceae bacterium]|nr:nucleotide exchange factor GrpE [Coxiellaceae bacterium]
MSKKDEASNKSKWQEIDEDAAVNELEDAVTDDQEETELQEGLEFPSHQALEDQLTAAEQKVAEFKDKAILAHAELENVRKRAERDVQNAHKFGAEKLLSDMLPVIDSLTRAIEGPEPTDEAAKSMRQGIELTLDMFEKALAKHGVDAIAPQPGDAFNPEQHEAMSAVPNSGQPENTVVQVLQKGYSLNGRVLRAAMVMVAQ